MNTILKTIGVTAATLICCWDAAVIPGAKPAKAYGRGVQCWYEQAYFVKHNCYAVAENEMGKIIQVCCE